MPVTTILASSFVFQYLPFDEDDEAGPPDGEAGRPLSPINFLIVLGIIPRSRLYISCFFLKLVQSVP